MKVLFCTIVSKYRLYQCIALYHSLIGFIEKLDFFVLTVDEESRMVLEALKLPGMEVIASEELEDNDLKRIKSQRNLSEYCWTLKPVLLLHLYESRKDSQVFAYLDSDLFFFDNPMKLFRVNRNCSVILTTHKVNRKSNGGFVAFTRCKDGYEALKWWKDKCIEWCYGHYDNGRFADQGYLDYMRNKFNGVWYLDMPGVNLATWNYFKYELTEKDGNLYVDGSRLLFYHFSGLRLKKIEGSIAICGAEVPCLVCGRYLNSIRNAIKEMEGVGREIADYCYTEM